MVSFPGTVPIWRRKRDRMPQPKMPQGTGLPQRKESPRMNTTDRTRPASPDTIEAAAPLRGLPESDRTLLIVDDDAPLCQRLARAMERRGFVVSTAESVATGTAAATGQPPAFAVVDLRLGGRGRPDAVSAPRPGRPA